ncbi:hypothetical protein CEXT_716761 [Caerostris extrusa]|uniref:Uncharacterized protein n=1 Tax=Caerostris extrusa TaxID=172846 RepID=A0AAV4RM83_CAEEX|nr:hypothetical protein CEXT_716761 [Caerostris extrusa]
MIARNKNSTEKACNINAFKIPVLQLSCTPIRLSGGTELQDARGSSNDRSCEEKTTLLTQQEQLDILGRLYAIFLEILLDLLTSSQSSPFLGAHCTSMAEKKGATADLLSIRRSNPAQNEKQNVGGRGEHPQRRKNFPER